MLASEHVQAGNCRENLKTRLQALQVRTMNTAIRMCSLLPRRSHTCLAYSSTFEVRHQHPPVRGTNRKVSQYLPFDVQIIKFHEEQKYLYPYPTPIHSKSPYENPFRTIECPVECSTFNIRVQHKRPIFNRRFKKSSRRVQYST
jgi:hypothetical protein